MILRLCTKSFCLTGEANYYTIKKNDPLPSWGCIHPAKEKVPSIVVKHFFKGEIMSQIKDIMTTDVFTLHATQTLALARFLMNLKHVRHIPIVKDDARFVGLLTHRDLLAHTMSLVADPENGEQEELDEFIHIVNVMKTQVITVEPEMNLCEAIPILLDNKYGCLPVVSNQKLVGIVTEADFLKLTLTLLQKDEEKGCS